MYQKTINDNMLIAEYMGWEPDRSGYYPATPPEFDDDGEACDAGPYQGNRPLYMLNQSWDWLMPVIEKIESEPDVKAFNIYNNRADIQISPGRLNIIVLEQPTKIQAAWKACVRFIIRKNKK